MDDAAAARGEALSLVPRSGLPKGLATAYTALLKARFDQLT